MTVNSSQIRAQHSTCTWFLHACMFSILHTFELWCLTSQSACQPTKDVCPEITADMEEKEWPALTLLRASNMGMRTNLMKPICAVGLVTLSRSMNGATGSPSLFSRSLCKKYSSRRQSTQGSAISVGRTSLEMSHALINIFLNCKKERGRERDEARWYVSLRSVGSSDVCAGWVHFIVHLYS